MSKLEITGWVLMVAASLLFANTFLYQDLDPSVRMKAEAHGGAGVRQIGYDNRKTLRWISGGLFLTGMICHFCVKDRFGDFLDKKNKKNDI